MQPACGKRRAAHCAGDGSSIRVGVPVDSREDRRSGFSTPVWQDDWNWSRELLKRKQGRCRPQGDGRGGGCGQGMRCFAARGTLTGDPDAGGFTQPDGSGDCEGSQG